MLVSIVETPPASSPIQMPQYDADNVGVDFGVGCQTSFQLQSRLEGW